MSFNIRLDRFFPGSGVSVRNDTASTGYKSEGISLSGTTAQSNTLPATGTYTTTATTGRFRIKIYNFGGTTPTLLAVNVLASDGTNSVVIFTEFIPTNTGMNLAGSTTKWYERMFDFMVDTASSGAGGGASGQLSGTVGGITSFTVQTILGGTSPTASMDIEVCPLI